MEGTGKTEGTSNGRVAAIACFGLALACVAVRPMIAARWPELALVPFAAAGGVAIVGIALLLRGLFASRAKPAPDTPDETVQIAPYAPEMSDGSDGVEAVRVALTPVAEAGSPTRGTAPLFVVGEETPAPQARTMSRQRVAKQRLGSEWSSDLQLSRRAQARLEADPFVQRLSRLG